MFESMHISLFPTLTWQSVRSPLLEGKTYIHHDFVDRSFIYDDIDCCNAKATIPPSHQYQRILSAQLDAKEDMRWV